MEEHWSRKERDANTHMHRCRTRTHTHTSSRFLNPPHVRICKSFLHRRDVHSSLTVLVVVVVVVVDTSCECQVKHRNQAETELYKSHHFIFYTQNPDLTHVLPADTQQKTPLTSMNSNSNQQMYKQIYTRTNQPTNKRAFSSNKITAFSSYLMI